MEPRLLLAAQPGLKAPPLGKLEGTLANLHAEFDAFVKTTPARGVDFRAKNKLLRTRGGLVAVDAIAAGDPKALLNELKALGLRNGAAVGSVVGGMLPIAALDELAALPGVEFARHGWAVTQSQIDAVTNGDAAESGTPGAGPAAQRGLTTSQADPAMRADLARSQYGVNGSGSIVGVLSDSFNTSGDGSYGADVASDDLPMGVNVLEDLAGGTDEGRAMAQLIYDSAPGAGLAFHTAFTSEAGFAQGITDLRNAGADVIVDDVIWLSEPMFQDGIIAQSVDAAVAAGVPYFSAAGNQARRAYEGAFRAGPVAARSSIAIDSTSTQAPSTFYGGMTHDFDPGAGVDNLQQFTLANGEFIQLSLQWDSPYRSAGPVGSYNDVDVYVLNADGTKIVGGAATDNRGKDPTEVVVFENTTGAAATFNLMVASFGTDPVPGYLKYVNFGAHKFTEFNTPQGTVFGHGNAAGASAVAAAFYGNTPAFGVSPPVVETFSSRGGTPIFFSASGTRLASPVNRAKPRITAPDGTNTTFFGNDSGQDADTYPNFFGTSAAAPHAAAVAALMQDAAGFLSPAAIYEALESTALDMDDPDVANFQTGRDNATGFGLIRADLAVGAVLGSARPGVPDLLPASDTGVSNGDDETNLDNTSAGKVLQFSVPNTVSGAVVTIYSAGVAVGSATANGTTTIVTTNGTVDMGEGIRSVTARQTEPGESQSVSSGELPIRVDTFAPTIDVADVAPDPRTDGVDRIEIRFNQFVAGVDLSDLSLKRNGGAVDLTGATLSTVDDQVYTLGNLAARTAAAGDYVLSVVAPHGITDVAGNVAGAASDAWQVTASDPAAPRTLRAVADAYARDGSFATHSFGGTPELVVKRSATAGNSRESFLRFDLAPVDSIASAKLRLFGRLSNTVNSSVTTTVYNSSNTSWPESTVNWNTRPVAGTTARGTVSVSGTTGRWYELDLSTFLKAEKAAGRNLVTLALKNLASSDAQVTFDSDESAANPPQLVVTPAAPPAQGLVVSTPDLSVAEGGSGLFTVKLAAQPASDVVVNVGRAALAPEDPDLTTATTSLTFTSANWNVAQTVSVAAAEDADESSGSTTFTLVASGIPGKSVVVTESDNDAPAGPVALRAAADAHVRDGTHAATNFGAATQLEVKQGSAGFTRQAYLRFDLSQVSSVGSAKLRLTGKLDNTQAASAGFSIYSSTDTAWSETGITWNAKPAVGTTVRGSGTVSGTTAKAYEVDLTNFLKAEKAAGRAAVTLVLKATAASAATIVFDSDEGASPPQLLVTPAGPPAQGIMVSTSNVTVPEGGGASFTVKLAVQPASDVVVGVAAANDAAADLDLTSAPSSVTFTSSNWDVPQTVTLAAAEDADASNGSRLIALTSTGLSQVNVTATEADNDTPSAPATPVLVRAAADAYVRDGATYAATNFGGAADLQVKQGSAGFTRESYLRFDTSSVATVSAAKLRLFGKLDNTQAASAGFTIFNASNTTWSESGVTWNAKLTPGTTARGSGTVTGTTAKWYEVDLTSFLQAEKTAGRNVVTLVIKATAASAATIVFDSDEGANRPELLVTA